MASGRSRLHRQRARSRIGAGSRGGYGIEGARRGAWDREGVYFRRVPDARREGEGETSGAAPGETEAFIPDIAEGFYGGLRVVGQVRGTYLVCESADALVLIDQHAAHERTAFERLKRDYADRRIQQQALLFPETLELGLKESREMNKALDAMGSLGISVEPFGGNSYLVRSVPAILGRADPRALVLDLLDALSDMGAADAFAAMFPGTYMPGTQMATDFYTDLRAEVRERMEKKIGIVKEEKFRLAWSGIPFWFNMGLINYFEESGGVVVIDTQYGCAGLTTDTNPGRRPDKWGMNGQVAQVMRAIIDYNCDGAVLSYTPTCRPLYINQLEIQNALMEELGVPSILLESDMVDPSSFQEGPIMTRIDAFIEVILEKVKDRDWMPDPMPVYGPKE